jgi:hypoxanthine phosphoribosyltransferase
MIAVGRDVMFSSKATAPGSETPACLLDERRIAQRVAELGEEITRRFAGSRLTLLGVLTGSYMFVADLSRHVQVPHEVAFVRAASYGQASVPAAEVTLEGLRPETVEGRDVLIVDDVLDTGHTLTTLLTAVRAAGAASVRTCVLIAKDRPRPYPVTPTLCGFVVPPVFVVGYGIDYRERWRDLRYVGWIEPQDG